MLPGLTSLLTSGPRDLGNSDETVATACNISRSLMLVDTEFSKKMISNELVSSLADLSENGSVQEIYVLFFFTSCLWTPSQAYFLHLCGLFSCPCCDCKCIILVVLRGQNRNQQAKLIFGGVVCSFYVITDNIHYSEKICVAGKNCLYSFDSFGIFFITCAPWIWNSII